MGMQIVDARLVSNERTPCTRHVSEQKPNRNPVHLSTPQKDGRKKAGKHHMVVLSRPPIAIGQLGSDQKEAVSRTSLKTSSPRLRRACFE
jgi:hypothetical protein